MWKLFHQYSFISVQDANTMFNQSWDKLDLDSKLPPVPGTTYTMESWTGWLQVLGFIVIVPFSAFVR